MYYITVDLLIQAYNILCTAHVYIHRYMNLKLPLSSLLNMWDEAEIFDIIAVGSLVPISYNLVILLIFMGTLL